MQTPPKPAIMLDLAFHARVLADHPYLESSRAALGSHELEAHVLDDGVLKTLRVHMDGALIYQSGDAMPAAEWFKVCREGGYRPRFDWDRDPVTILFHGVLPAMAEGWTEFALPYDADGYPEGVASLKTLQEAHAAFVARLLQAAPEGAAAQVAELFAHLPLRALVLHDRPEERVDYLGNALDEAYVGLDLILANTPEHAVRLGKVSLSSTGGMRWSPWLPGGRWTNGGREFVAEETAADFLLASGLGLTPVEGFGQAFDGVIQAYAAFMDGPVDRYLAVFPAAIPWHHDPGNQYLHRSVSKAEQVGEHLVLTFENGLKAMVPRPDYLTVQPGADPRGETAPEPPAAHVLE
jgi:hypothetical protein